MKFEVGWRVVVVFGVVLKAEQSSNVHCGQPSLSIMTRTKKAYVGYSARGREKLDEGQPEM